MSLSARIAAHLPFLRRYARSLTGTQTSGDAYVAATIEALIADVSSFPETSSDRVSLYKMFAAIFGSASISVPGVRSPYAWEQQAMANLSSLSDRSRQAILLVSVEGFDRSEAGEILDADDSELLQLLDEAAHDISRQIATDIMIVEDEPLIAMDIEQMVLDLGHRVTGIARTHKEAVELFRRTQPKMILADIQLADGSSGIEAMNEIIADTSLPIIFITAFPERLLTGERPEPTFLVTKPFNPEMVKALISQALFFNQSSRAAA